MNLPIDPKFMSALKMYMECDPEKAKEYSRKANLVLFKLPWPETYIQAIKDFVMGTANKEEDKADGANAKVEGMIRIKVKTDGDEETSEYVDIAPGSKIHITQAPLRPGIDYSE